MDAIKGKTALCNENAQAVPPSDAMRNPNLAASAERAKIETEALPVRLLREQAALAGDANARRRGFRPPLSARREMDCRPEIVWLPSRIIEKINSMIDPYAPDTIEGVRKVLGGLEYIPSRSRLDPASRWPQRLCGTCGPAPLGPPACA